MAKYFRNSAGLLKEEQAISSSAGAGDANKIVETGGDGKLSITLMPSGIGTETVNIIASENLTAGNLVNVHDSAGTANVRKADASNGRLADGFVLSNVTSGQTATVYFEGAVTGLTGLTIGVRLFLSGTTPGAVTATAPSSSGHYVQQVGVSSSTSAFSFSPQLPFQLL